MLGRTGESSGCSAGGRWESLMFQLWSTIFITRLVTSNVEIFIFEPLNLFLTIQGPDSWSWSGDDLSLCISSHQSCIVKQDLPGECHGSHGLHWPHTRHAALDDRVPHPLTWARDRLRLPPTLHSDDTVGGEILPGGITHSEYMLCYALHCHRVDIKIL